MRRLLPILVGAVVLVAGGVVHGLWTDRWHPPEDLERAAGRLTELPDDIDTWKGKESPLDAESLAMAGAVGCYSRSFTDPVTGESVLVILMAGKARRMSIHRPEHCYRSSGYQMADQPLDIKLTPAGQPTTPLWTALFTRDDPSAGSSQLRIFWTWHDGHGWEAPDKPRWAFARRHLLYKLYVIHAVSAPVPLAADPGVRLMGKLLPMLNRTLAEE